MAHRWGRDIGCVLLIPVLLARSSTAGMLVCCTLILSNTDTHTECNFEYRNQPSSTTENGCSPYNSGNIIIALECAVRRMDGVSTTFLIRWFREITTAAVEDLGLGDPVVQQGRDRTTRYHDTAFLNQPYSPSLLGKYWCQVINTTADPDQPLMRSNVFTLLAPGNYSELRCMGITVIQEETNITCADLPGNQPVQLTTPLVLTAQTLTSYATLSLTPTEPTLSIAATTTMTSLPAPATTTSVIVYTAAGVSGGVLVVAILCCCIVILIVMKRRRRKTVGQATIQQVSV